MIIITDTREARNQHVLEAFSKAEIPFKVKKLHFGDYSMEDCENKVIIERKATLTELSGNLTKGRKRFAAEFERARQAGAKIYLLIEDEKARQKMVDRQAMDDIGDISGKDYAKTWRSKFTARAMIASLASWKVKYDLEIIFVSKKDSGAKIIEIFEKFLEGENGANNL